MLVPFKKNVWIKVASIQKANLICCPVARIAPLVSTGSSCPNSTLYPSAGTSENYESSKRMRSWQLLLLLLHDDAVLVAG